MRARTADGPCGFNELVNGQGDADGEGVSAEVPVTGGEGVAVPVPDWVDAGEGGGVEEPDGVLDDVNVLLGVAAGDSVTPGVGVRAGVPVTAGEGDRDTTLGAEDGVPLPVPVLDPDIVDVGEGSAHGQNRRLPACATASHVDGFVSFVL